MEFSLTCLYINQRWFLLTALPVQQGSRRGVVFSALIIYQVVEILCRHYTLHSGSHQFILFTCKDLAASESGFLSESLLGT